VISEYGHHIIHFIRRTLDVDSIHIGFPKLIVNQKLIARRIKEFANSIEKSNFIHNLLVPSGFILHALSFCAEDSTIISDITCLDCHLEILLNNLNFSNFKGYFKVATTATNVFICLLGVIATMVHVGQFNLCGTSAIRAFDSHSETSFPFGIFSIAYSARNVKWFFMGLPYLCNMHKNRAINFLCRERIENSARCGLEAAANEPPQIWVARWEK
jgi:hypothetical protein